MTFDRYLKTFILENEEVLPPEESEDMEQREMEELKAKEKAAIQAITQVFAKCGIQIEMNHGGQRNKHKIFYDAGEKDGTIYLENSEISSKSLYHLLDSEIFSSFTILAVQDVLRMNFVMNESIKFV